MRRGRIGRAAGRAASWLRRAVRLLPIAIVLLALTAGLVLTGRSDLVLGEAVTYPRDGKLPVNPELADATSVLDLSDGAVRGRDVPRKTVALTFDDGPDPVWTPRLQAVLDRHDVPGTFFVIGARVLEYPDIVRDLDAAGHEVGNHSFTHAQLGALDGWQVDTQISLTQRAVVGAIGKRPTSFRPPYSGEAPYLPPAELAATRRAARAGLVPVLTDRVVPDYDPKVGVAALVRGATPRRGEGAVLTFHDSGGDRQRTVEAVDRLITELKADGYEFVLASELTGVAPNQAEPGERWMAAVMVHGSVAVTKGAQLLFVVGIAYAVLGIVRSVVLLVFAVRSKRRTARRASGGDTFLPPVSVIVPAYNEAVGIEATVRSLLASDHPDLEVIVVDDGSSDGTAAIAEGLGLPGVRVVRKPNGGKPSALNAGLAVARHDIVVMVDGDTMFDRATVRRLVQPFADTDVGAVAGNPRVGNRRGFVSTLQHIEYCVGSSLERRMFDEVGAMLCIPGAIGAFRRHAIVDVGGVSADTLAEDTDLTMALTRAGWRIAYVPDAHAYTEVPTTVRGLYLQRYRWAYGILQSVAKHRRAVIEGGRAGVLGRFVIPYTIVLGYLAALTAPAIDLLTVYALATGRMGRDVILLAALVNGFSVLTALSALRLERAPLRHAWVLPFQVVIYRQVLYVVTLRSMWSALLGVRLRWNSVARQGGVRNGDGAVLDLGGDEPVVDLREPAHAAASEKDLVLR